MYCRVSSHGAMPCFHNLTTITMDAAASVVINTELFRSLLCSLLVTIWKEIKAYLVEKLDVIVSLSDCVLIRTR